MPRRLRANRSIQVERDARVWHLRTVEAKSLRAVANELGISHETVRTIEVRVAERESKQLGEHFHHLKSVHHARNEWMYGQWIEAYLKSKEPAARARITEKGGEEISIREQAEREGDPRHIHTALAVLEADRKLLGLDVSPAQNPEDAELIAEAQRLEQEAERERRAYLGEQRAQPPTIEEKPSASEGPTE
jgi:hypothetical protein